MSCPKCAEGHLLPGEPKGSILPEYQGAYFAPGPGGPDTPSKRAVLLLTDAFGLPLVNCKIMADELARRLECDVWVPDYFNGRPLIPPTSRRVPLPDKAGEKPSTWEFIKFIVLVILPNIGAFISNRMPVVVKRTESFIQLIKEKKHYTKVGAAGYCYGGSVGIKLAPTNLIDSIVILHPGGFTIDQIKAIKIPNAWACSEDEMAKPTGCYALGKAYIESNVRKESGVQSEFVEYKGTAHGFAARPNLEIPEVRAGYEGAFEQTVNWLNKTLKDETPVD